MRTRALPHSSVTWIGHKVNMQCIYSACCQITQAEDQSGQQLRQVHQRVPKMKSSRAFAGFLICATLLGHAFGNFSIFALSSISASLHSRSPLSSIIRTTYCPFHVLLLLRSYSDDRENTIWMMSSTPLLKEVRAYFAFLQPLVL